MRYWRVPGSSIHVFWLIACELAAEKSFQQMSCILWYPCESHRAQPALQRTGHWGVATLMPHISLAPGLGVFLVPSCTAFTCLTTLGIFFGLYTAMTFPTSEWIPASRAEGTVKTCLARLLYDSLCSSLWSFLFQYWNEKNISIFLPHIYILCNQNNQEL